MPRTACCNCDQDLNPEFVNLSVSGDTELNTLTTTGQADLACLSVDTNLIFTDCVNNRVGILDSTPSYVMDINGTLRVVGAVLFDSTFDSTGVFHVTPISITSDVDTTIDGSLIVDTSVLVVDSSLNRVGVNDASPSFDLDVNGTFRITGAGQFDSTVIITDDLNVDSGVLFVDVSTNQVGINDTTPSFGLDVNGTLRSTGAVQLDSTLLVTGISTFNQKIIHSPTVTNDYVYLSQPAKTVNDTNAKESYLLAGSATSDSAANINVFGLDTQIIPTTASPPLVVARGAYFTPELHNSSVNVTGFDGLMVRADISASYTGTVASVFGVHVRNTIIGVGGSTPTNLYGIYVETINTGTTNYSLYTNNGLVVLNGRTLINTNNSTIPTNAGLLHINQHSTTLGLPTLHLEQDDVSEEFVRFTGASAAATLTRSLVPVAAVTTFTVNGYIRINVQDEGNQITDGNYYMAFGTLT